MTLFNTFSTWCTGSGFGHGSGWGMSGYSPFHMGGLFQILLIGLVVFLAVKVLRKPPVATSGSLSPLDTLKSRYAEGKIDKQTYDRMKHELR